MALYHLVNSLTNDAGDALVGYYVRLRSIATGSVATIYADPDFRPIENVSGVENAARTDSNGLYSIYVADGSYDIEFYDRNDVLLLLRIVSDVPMFGRATADAAAASAAEAAISAAEAAISAEEAASGVAAWGNITGTLSAQTDLQTALDGKQPLATVLTNTTAAFTTAQETKLAGVAAGATANSTDATLLNRANHTGAQVIATVTGLQAALDGKAAAAHGHVIADVTGLQAALDGKQVAGSYQPLATVLTNTTAAFTTAQETKLAGIASGATANTGTVTSIGGTGTVNGLTLSGSVTTSGNLTLGGTLTGVNLTSAVTGVLPLANGGTGANLADPNADRLLFWDDSAGQMTFLSLGTNLSITGTTLDATGGGGSGTVTTVSVTTANGVSGSVANATTTPAITLTLGAITPTSVAASGTVTGSNLSGTNTGDQTIATVPGLQTALDGKQPLATVLTNTTAAFTTAQETKLAGVATGATANVGTVTSVGGTGTVSGLTLTGSVTASGNLTLGGTLSTTSAALTDFNSASRAQTEAALVAGANVTITPSGSGATRQLTIAATGGGGGGGAPWDAFISQAADYTLTSTTAQQRIFDTSANGRLTLATGLYEFRCMVAYSSMSATSGNANFSILGAGSAVLGGQFMDGYGLDNNAAINGAAVARGGATALLASAFSGNTVTAGTGTQMTAVYTGFIRVTTAGTIVPSVALITAAAAVVRAGSIFAIRRVADDTVHQLGSWD
jgi:hypothetical protein